MQSFARQYVAHPLKPKNTHALPRPARQTLRTSLLCLLLSLVGSVAANDAVRVDQYITIFEKGGPASNKQAAQELAWAGLSDPRLFDVIEKQLLDYLPNVSDRRSADHAAWLSKALSYSGDARYLPTLQKVCVSPQSRYGQLKRHCQMALAELTRYQTLNPIIADRSGYVEGRTDEVNRYAAMLRSGNLDVQLLAAKRIHFQRLYDDYLLNQLQQVVEPVSMKLQTSHKKMETTAWMLRALAGPGQAQYRPTLEQATKSVDPDIRKYSRQFLNKFY